MSAAFSTIVGARAKTCATAGRHTQAANPRAAARATPTSRHPGAACRASLGFSNHHAFNSTSRARSVRVAADGDASSDITEITDNINAMPTVCDISTTNSCTVFVAETKLPTTSGYFRVRAYRHWVPVRVHDACFTSEVLGSLKCDCAEQLQYALDYIQTKGPGIVVYLQQEGRGIGLANKIAAYHMQEKGYDTVDANRALNLPDDTREYSAVANILKDLDIKSIKLMTNNPRKIERLGSLGVKVADRIPVEMEAQEHSEGYLKAKGERMNHMFSTGKATEEA